MVFGSMNFCGHGSIVLGLRDYTDDIIQTMMIMIGSILSFSILFCHWGLWCSQKAAKLWLLWRLLATPIVDTKVILAPYRFWAYLSLFLGRFTNMASWKSWSVWSKIRFLKKIEHHWWECVLLDLIGFALIYESLFYLSNENSKANRKEVLLAE